MKMVEELVGLAYLEADEEAARLYILAYAFLLRVPSEGLPVIIGDSAEIDAPLLGGVHSRLCGTDDRVTLRLGKRKNLVKGSCITSYCWCAQSAPTCPVHALKPLFLKERKGEAPFSHMTPHYVIKELRRRLRILAFPFANEYGTHDFRRGHARDLLERGSTLKEILNAGDWRSPRFLAYLDLDKLEASVVVEAHLADSDSDDQAA